MFKLLSDYALLQIADDSPFVVVYNFPVSPKVMAKLTIAGLITAILILVVLA